MRPSVSETRVLKLNNGYVFRCTVCLPPCHRALFRLLLIYVIPFSGTARLHLSYSPLREPLQRDTGAETLREARVSLPVFARRRFCKRRPSRWPPAHTRVERREPRRTSLLVLPLTHSFPSAPQQPTPSHRHRCWRAQLSNCCTSTGVVAGTLATATATASVPSWSAAEPNRSRSPPRARASAQAPWRSRRRRRRRPRQQRPTGRRPATPCGAGQCTGPART